MFRLATWCYVLTTAGVCLAQPPVPPVRAPVTKLAEPARLLDADLGQAAPAVGDINSDGVWDLPVGHFPNTQYRPAGICFYRNLGTNAPPQFGSVSWF